MMSILSFIIMYFFICYVPCECVVIVIYVYLLLLLYWDIEWEHIWDYHHSPSIQKSFAGLTRTKMDRKLETNQTCGVKTKGFWHDLTIIGNCGDTKWECDQHTSQKWTAMDGWWMRQTSQFSLGTMIPGRMEHQHQHVFGTRHGGSSKRRKNKWSWNSQKVTKWQP